MFFLRVCIHFSISIFLTNGDVGSNKATNSGNLLFKLICLSKNSIKTSNDASKAIENDLNAQSTVISAEGQVFYAQALPPAGKGLVGTVQMIPVTKQMVEGVKANPISAITAVGGLAKVIPNLPSYIQTIQKTMKLITSRAKAEGIEGADDPALEAEEDDFDL